MPQEPTPFNDTIYANATLPDPTLTEDDAWRARIIAIAAGFVRDLLDGLYAPMGGRGTLLSGSQFQWIAIARVLIGQPRLMILEEITTAMDPESEARIVQKIREVDRSITVFTVIHPKAVLDIANTIYDVKDRRVTEELTKIPARQKALCRKLLS